MQYRGRRETGQLSPLFFTLAQILKIFERLQRTVPATSRGTGSDEFPKDTTTVGCVGGFMPKDNPRKSKRPPSGSAATSPRGAHPRARGASHRACAQDGRWLAFPRRPAVPARVKNCMTRSERGGHLRLQGTSAEPVWAEEKRCASAPETVTGNSHLTGEASPSSPEVWRFCVAGEAAVAVEAAVSPNTRM